MVGKCRSGIYLVVTCLFCAGAQAGIMTNMVAHLPLDGNALDVTGNGHDGTVFGAALTSDRFGNPNSAYSFDGVNDYIDLGSMGGFKSVSMWVKQGVRSSFDFYFGHSDFRIFASSSDNGRLTLADGAEYVVATANMDSYEGQWVHIVGISDGLQSKLYLNGVNVATSTGNLKSVGDMTVNLGRWPGNSHYLNGAIDDVRIFDKALSDQEVSALYAIPEPSSAILIVVAGGLLYFKKRVLRWRI